MLHRLLPVVPTHGGGRTLGAVALVVVLLLAGLLLTVPSSVTASPAAPAPTPAASPAAAFNPPCAPINVTGVCVSIQNPNEPDIVPATGTQSPVEPSTTQNLPLVVKSEAPLNTTTSASARSGPDSPIILNVTGTLWNGDPYYSNYDGSVFHSATDQWWDGPLNTTNTTYRWWYLVNISATTTGGQANFLPGMSMTWSIEITYNVSGNFIHEGGPDGPQFHYTYDGAWPKSPYKGSTQYDGAAAYGQDLTTTVVPSQPNWNDSVTVSLATTPLDVAQNASIGQAYLDVTEHGSNGTLLGTATFSVSSPNGVDTGVAKTHFTIPASYAQQANATVLYVLHVSDVWGDWVTSAPATYKVGGNGSFAVGQFGDDLGLVSSPNVNFPTSPIAPGTPVALHLTSQNQHTAIASATIFYSVDLPELGTVNSFSSAMSRINSTSFSGTIPGLPLGAGVNFTVEAWDFASTGEVSTDYNYSVQPIGTVLPSIADNGTFFYVAVRDAGAGTWVNGATVSVIGPGAYFRSVGTTFAGLAYPNATGAPYSPIVVPAGSTYTVTVDDPGFHGGSGTTSGVVTLQLPATHAMGAHTVLAANNSYAIYESGDLVVFWLNGTLPSAPVAPPETSSVFIGSIVGLVVASAAVYPLVGWYRRIQKRREEETKRVTL